LFPSIIITLVSIIFLRRYICLKRWRKKKKKTKFWV
jgi:hypothetical protein